MLKLLTDAGAQITRELYEFAIKNHASKISKIMAAKLGIQKENQISEKRIKYLSSNNHDKSEGVNISFNYNVNDDAKVIIWSIRSDRQKNLLFTLLI